MQQPQRVQLNWVWPELLQGSLTLTGLPAVSRLAVSSADVAVSVRADNSPIVSLCTKKSLTTVVVLIIKLSPEKSFSTRFLREASFNIDPLTELASNPGSELAVEAGSPNHVSRWGRADIQCCLPLWTALVLDSSCH